MHLCFLASPAGHRCPPRRSPSRLRRRIRSGGRPPPFTAFPRSTVSPSGRGEVLPSLCRPLRHARRPSPKKKPYFFRRELPAAPYAPSGRLFPAAFRGKNPAAETAGTSRIDPLRTVTSDDFFSGSAASGNGMADRCPAFRLAPTRTKLQKQYHAAVRIRTHRTIFPYILFPDVSAGSLTARRADRRTAGSSSARPSPLRPAPPRARTSIRSIPYS